MKARLVSLFLVCAIARGATASTPGEVPIGGVLREATLVGLNGPARRLSDFRGRPLIINVWASWCGPCRQEMASLERLSWLDSMRSVAIIGISTDDYRDNALSFLRRSNATISHYIDRQMQLETMLGARKIPATILVGADGRVLAKIVGARQWDGDETLKIIRDTFQLPPRTP